MPKLSGLNADFTRDTDRDREGEKLELSGRAGCVESRNLRNDPHFRCLLGGADTAREWQWRLC